MFCLQATKANGVRALFEATGKNGFILYYALGGHIISQITVFAEMWNTQGKSLKA